MRYFRVSQNIYEVGSTIWETTIGPNNKDNLMQYKDFFNQGNELAVLKTVLAYPSTADAAKEGALEFIRSSEFITLPSRFENMMVFNSIDDAISFKDKYRVGREAKIYEIEYPDEIPIFMGDMRIVDEVGSISEIYSDLIKMSRRYWSGEKTEDPLLETLLTERERALILREVI